VSQDSPLFVLGSSRRPERDEPAPWPVYLRKLPRPSTIASRPRSEWPVRVWQRRSNRSAATAAFSDKRHRPPYLTNDNCIILVVARGLQ
jgi:hypothetical protein